MVFQNSCSIFLKKQRVLNCFFVVVYIAHSKQNAGQIFMVSLCTSNINQVLHCTMFLVEVLCMTLTLDLLHWRKHFFNCGNKTTHSSAEIFTTSHLRQWPPVVNNIPFCLHNMHDINTQHNVANNVKGTYLLQFIIT